MMQNTIYEYSLHNYRRWLRHSLPDIVYSMEIYMGKQEYLEKPIATTAKALTL